MPQPPRYPTAQIDVWRLSDGTRVTLRPVLPQDAPLLDEMMRRLSPTTRRNRFHGAVNWLAESELQRLCCVDHERHVAFVITTAFGGRERLVAEARYLVDAQGKGDTAEFALVVDDAWQRQGLGARAIQALVTAALQAGLHWLHGEVLTQNRPMLALMHGCRFCCTPDREDEAIVHAESSLTPAPLRWPSRLGVQFKRWRRGFRRRDAAAARA